MLAAHLAILLRSVFHLTATLLADIDIHSLVALCGHGTSSLSLPSWHIEEWGHAETPAGDEDQMRELCIVGWTQGPSYWCCNSLQAMKLTAWWVSCGSV